MAKRRSISEEQTIQYERRIYDLEQLLEISKSFNSTLETTTLLESIVFSCMAQLHVANAGIFVQDFINSDYLVLKTQQNVLNPVGNLDFQFSTVDPIVPTLTAAKKPVSLEYLKKECPESPALQIFELLKPTLIVPLLQRNRLNGILYLCDRFFVDPGEESEYSDYEKNLVFAIGSLASIAISNAILLERSSTDMMTQLKLKYFFFNSLAEKLDMAVSQKLPLSIIMFDIDFFKHFNDSYGHECGDYVLKEVAKLIKDNLRTEDLASRYGGEEFTVLLHETKKEAALAIAERIRSTIEAHDFVYNDQHMHVTISCGVSVFDEETNPITNPKQLVNQADQGLYMSKHNGRNRVTYAFPSLVSGLDEDGK